MGGASPRGGPGLRDPAPAILQQAKFAFYRCTVLLRWPLRHTLFCSLAWERGLSARHFLWTSLVSSGGQTEGELVQVSAGPAPWPQRVTGMLSSGQMTHNQKKFSIYLTQALSYLHSHHHHVKIWAALFLGDGVAGSGSPQACPLSPKHPDALGPWPIHLAPVTTGAWGPLPGEDRWWVRGP